MTDNWQRFIALQEDLPENFFPELLSWRFLMGFRLPTDAIVRELGLMGEECGQLFQVEIN